MGRFVEWLLNTDINPYGIFGDEGGRMCSAESFSGLISHISNALYDDGEICFPVINGVPRIRFIDYRTPNILKHVLTEQEIEMNAETMLRELHQLEDEENIWELEGLLKDFDEFMIKADEAEILDLRNCFMLDAEDDLQKAIRDYSSHSKFDQKWIGEFKKMES